MSHDGHASKYGYADRFCSITMASPQPQQINVADLDTQQLADVRRQLEEVNLPPFSLVHSADSEIHTCTQELNHLTSSFAQLKQAQSKFKSCLENVGEVKPKNAGTTILVPLTNSLYVPGKLSDTEHVIVDVGTGYYSQTRAEATKYFKAKVEFIHANLETLSDTIQKKQDNMNYLINVMQAKLQAQAQAMFSRISAFLAITIAAATVASARMERHVHVRRDNTASQCDTGDVKCCNSITNASSIASILNILSYSYDPADSVAIDCTPLNIYGAGEAAACQQQPVCCSNNTYRGFINIGCSPMDLN
ncbi:Prefoldin subunit-domain-containing protein [Lanmaoa asiatica]|nr:Prefoldin subunit-domain-containing protein [Lanmaoa asiatica]